MPITGLATSTTCKCGWSRLRNRLRWALFISLERFGRWRILSHQHDMFLHMDGARIANAAVSLGQSLREATRDLGVDVLTFGGTKNGMMGGEAVVFFRPGLSRDFLFLRKQGMQLNSKMRFVAVQFEALLSHDLWQRSAEHAESHGAGAATGVAEVSAGPDRVAGRGEWSFRADSARRDCENHGALFLLSVDRGECIVRWMCSFDTTEEDVQGVRRACGGGSKRMKPALYPAIAFRFSIE